MLQLLKKNGSSSGKHNDHDDIARPKHHVKGFSVLTMAETGYDEKQQLFVHKKYINEL